MITRITGTLNRVLDDEVRLQVGGLEYAVLVAEYVRRVVQTKVGQELTLHTNHFMDGNPMQGKVVPRLLGFQHEADLDFFDLFCTVDKIGTRKALKALVRPVREVADAIQRQDVKWLTTLPGVGGPTAEKIIATLKKKVARFALAPAPTIRPTEGDAEPVAVVGGEILDEAYAALIALGMNPIEARIRLDNLLATGKTFASTEEVIREIYSK
jgi:Holliday junction DNA helicase RuvA